MKFEGITQDIIGAAMVVLNFKEAKLTWKRVVTGQPEPAAFGEISDIERNSQGKSMTTDYTDFTDKKTDLAS